MLPGADGYAVFRQVKSSGVFNPAKKEKTPGLHPISR